MTQQDSLRVLLVDDTPIYRLFLEHVLQPHEKLILATFEFDAPVLVAKEKPTLVIVNIDAESIPAMKLSRVLREVHSDDFGVLVGVGRPLPEIPGYEDLDVIFDHVIELPKDYKKLYELTEALKEPGGEKSWNTRPGQDQSSHMRPKPVQED